MARRGRSIGARGPGRILSTGAPAVCIELDVAAGDAELAADRLWAAGATAVEERDGGAPGRRALIAGIPAGTVDTVLGALDPAWRPRVVEVDDGAWADAWRDYAGPVRVGRRLVVVPAWIDAVPDESGADMVTVRLDPGRAFGSGTHATTQLALAALEGLVGGGAATVLDVGSGSGVLAVAAALLGAQRVVAVDTDPEAVRATAENAARNGVGGTVEGRLGHLAEAVPEDDSGRFDVVVVNIGAAAIIEAAAVMQSRLAPGGHLVLTGFLAPATPRVRAAFGDLDPVAEAGDGEWRLLTLRSRAQ